MTDSRVVATVMHGSENKPPVLRTPTSFFGFLDKEDHNV